MEEEEEEKERDGHLEAHMEGDNKPSLNVDRGKVLHEGPGTGVVDELMKGTQEDPQDPGKIHPEDLQGPPSRRSGSGPAPPQGALSPPPRLALGQYQPRT